MSKQLFKQFQRHLLRRRFFIPGETVVVAVSTGVDSMTLLDLLLQLPSNQQPTIVIAHVNHELRRESDTEEQFIRRFAKHHQLQLYVGHWRKSDHPQTGIEDAGRNFRYRFFKQVMRKTGAHILMTAHHADDQAETVLMKLVRGDALPSLRGIAVMRPFASGKLVRPLLPFSKDDIKAYAHRRHLKWFDDATNDSLSITRNRYRHQYLPSLEKENTRAKEHVNEFAMQLNDVLIVTDTYCQGLFKKIAGSEQNSIDLAAWYQLNNAEQRVFLAWWVRHCGIVNVKQNQFEEIISSLDDRSRPQLKLDLAHSYQLIKNYQQFFIQHIEQNKNNLVQLRENVVELGAWYPLGQHDFGSVMDAKQASSLGSNVEKHEMWLAPKQLPLTFRPLRSGDRLLIKGHHYQKAHRILIDHHVSSIKRKQQMVLVDANGIVVWLVGQKLSWFDRIENYQSAWQHLFLCRREVKGEPDEQRYSKRPIQ